MTTGQKYVGKVDNASTNEQAAKNRPKSPLSTERQTPQEQINSLTRGLLAGLPGVTVVINIHLDYSTRISQHKGKANGINFDSVVTQKGGQDHE